MKLPFLTLAGTAILLLSILSCQLGAAPAFKIGYVNPITGPLSGNGEGYDWVIDQMYEYAQEHPILLHGRKANLEIIVYDSKSDPEVCAKMAERMVLYDKVNLLIATQTPETVIPVTGIAEKYGVPCVSIQAPVDPVASARERYDWTYHAFWTIDKIYECYRGLWTQAGYPPQSGAKVGTLFANDADGNAWHTVFVQRARADGYTVIDPGQYPPGNSDFAGIAARFLESGVDVLIGTNLPPDFMNAMSAFKKAGLQIGCITMGKCCLMVSDTSALGEAAVGIMSEIWWDDSNNYRSDLTGLTASEIGQRYAADNFGSKMPQPAAYAYAALELALHALYILRRSSQ